jgi:hypothetical protein
MTWLVAGGGFGGIENVRRGRKKKNHCFSLMHDIEMLSGY